MSEFSPPDTTSELSIGDKKIFVRVQAELAGGADGIYDSGRFQAVTEEYPEVLGAGNSRDEAVEDLREQLRKKLETK